METSRKIKYSRIDRLILGIAYALLGLFVLSIVIPLIYVTSEIGRASCRERV